MENLILIRHGETGDNKSDPKRALTKEGQRKVGEVALLLSRNFKDKEFLILTTDTYRAVQTSNILAKELTVNKIVKSKLRILNLDNLRSIIQSNEKKRIRPAKTYLSMPDNQLKELEVETSDQVFNRWTKLIKDFKAKNVIIVSHECSLEAFLSKQKGYTVIRKSFKKYFNYGDFAILTKKI